MKFFYICLLSFLIMGCADFSSTSSSDDGKKFTYNMTADPSHFPVGSKVTIVRTSFSDSGCSTETGNLSTYSEAITETGSVTISFTDSRDQYFGETIYVDNEPSDNLSNGDLVWGTNPVGFAYYCADINVLNSTQTFNWSDLGASAGGVTTYTGETQSYSILEEMNDQQLKIQLYNPSKIEAE